MEWNLLVGFAKIIITIKLSSRSHTQRNTESIMYYQLCIIPCRVYMLFFTSLTLHPQIHLRQFHGTRYAAINPAMVSAEELEVQESHLSKNPDSDEEQWDGGTPSPYLALPLSPIFFWLFGNISHTSSHVCWALKDILQDHHCGRLFCFVFFFYYGRSAIFNQLLKKWVYFLFSRWSNILIITCT